MNTQLTVFAQIMAFLPLYEFRKCVWHYRGDYKVRRFSCLARFFCLALDQPTCREGLRDIVSYLQTMKDRLYHMGIRGRVTRNNSASANETRDWRIFADIALEPGSFCILDRGYLNFSRLYALHQHQMFFVIWAKSNLQSRRISS